MDFLYGVLTTVLFLFALLSFYYIGYKQGNKRTSKHPNQDNDELQKAREMRKGFMNMMEYDVDKALQRKKVT